MSRTIAALTGDFERVSQIYARTCGIDRDADWFVLKLQEELGELVQAHLRMTGRGRDKGEGDEAFVPSSRTKLPTCSASYCCSCITTGSTSRPLASANGSVIWTSDLSELVMQRCRG